MGIKTLWSILDCCGETVDLRTLQSTTIAIDLAGWVVSNNQVRGMMYGKVSKPHLRNVFFRTAALISMGIKPIFVLDGTAPALKLDTLETRRMNQGFGGSQKQSQSSEGGESKSLTRKRLNALMNECKFLLSTMGIQCIQAEGEGEALCGLLNASGMVDAVITEDSDIFCYGARTVLRNFSITSKAAFSVERYHFSRISKDLGLSRDRIMLMAIFLGCDFFPSGIPGVGKETVLQLFNGWKQCWDALEVMQFWINTKFESNSCYECKNDLYHCTYCQNWSTSISDGGCICNYFKENPKLMKTETTIKKRCMKMDMEWWRNDYDLILQEFDVTEPLPDISECRQHSCPKISQCMSILVKKLAWEQDYSQERMIPILTRWQIDHLAEGGTKEVIRPKAITKKRVVNTIPSLVFSWEIIDSSKVEVQGLPDNFESVEPLSVAESAYPDLCAEFITATTKPKKLTKRAPSRTTSKKIKPLDDNLGTQQQITNFFNQQKPSSSVKDTAIKSKSIKKDQKRIKAAIHIRSLSPSPNQDSIVLSEEDVSDLSELIDDLLSHKVQNMSVEMKDDENIVDDTPMLDNFTTSTPVSKKTISRKNFLQPIEFNKNTTIEMEDVQDQPPVTTKKPISIFNHNNDNDDQENCFDEFEDSFDRMCK